MKRRTFVANKLWRDKTIKLLEESGSIIHCKELNDFDFDIELKNKLIEEAAEVQSSKNKEELIAEIADVYEVIDSLRKLHSISHEEIVQIQTKKRNVKGDFMSRKYVTNAEHPVGSHGEKYFLADPDKYKELV